MQRAYTAHVDTFARDNLPPPDQWPEFAGLDELAYPPRMNCAAELLDKRILSGHGGRAVLHALVDGRKTSCTYGELMQRANRIARVIREDLRLVPGTRVLLRAPNNPMLVACWFAVLKAGCIAVTTMPLLRAKELVPIIDKAKVAAALCDERLAGELESAKSQSPGLKQILCFDSLARLLEHHPPEFQNVDTASDDVALIAFTSGTTGQPKGTVHFHRDMITMSSCYPRAFLEPSASDICCGTPPLAFTFGLGSLLGFPMLAGAASVLVERLTPEALLQTIQDFRATACFTAPTYYRKMAAIAKSFDLSSLRKCISAGEALPDATRQLFKRSTGIEIMDGIGSTEMTHMFISHTPARVRRGAIGYPVPGYRATVLDASGAPCAPGQIGRLAVKGPTGCRYLADARQGAYVHNGWNLTGDAAKMDADGYFYYHARTDDMIISAGYNIAGPEVEAALLEHEAVAECGVVGVPDEERGQVVKAFVVLKKEFPENGETVKTLQEHVKKTIAPYKYPRKIDFVSELPRTETGKLQRFKLRSSAP
ncbi:MAG: 2-aminobenzoate-CoA ligase [Betaproteobacteria bacterium]|nr:MAG: 2-aminobenzoate-CoA ligase [Betaproteobacteria bacterium]